MKERGEAMREIWTNSPASYSGQFVNFSEIITNPKPFQKPYPPVLVGGAFPYGGRRAIDYGDGWLPHAWRPHYGDVIHQFPEFRKMALAARRSPESIPISVYGIKDDPDLLKQYRDAGTKRVVFALPSEGKDRIMPLLDHYSRFISMVT